MARGQAAMRSWSEGWRAVAYVTQWLAVDTVCAALPGRHPRDRLEDAVLGQCRFALGGWWAVQLEVASLGGLAAGNLAAAAACQAPPCCGLPAGAGLNLLGGLVAWRRVEGAPAPGRGLAPRLPGEGATTTPWPAHNTPAPARSDHQALRGYGTRALVPDLAPEANNRCTTAARRPVLATRHPHRRPTPQGGTPAPAAMVKFKYVASAVAAAAIVATGARLWSLYRALVGRVGLACDVCHPMAPAPCAAGRRGRRPANCRRMPHASLPGATPGAPQGHRGKRIWGM